MKRSYVCPVCEKSFERREAHVVNDHPTCSRHCGHQLLKKLHGDKSAAWQGGHPTLNTLGYLVRTIRKRTYLVHRLVMEDHLGRPLERGEVVHHVNGIRTDNRIENLVLCETQAAHVSNHHKRGSTRTICGICGQPEKARGLCNAHYTKAKRAGLF